MDRRAELALPGLPVPGLQSVYLEDPRHKPLRGYVMAAIAIALATVLLKGLGDQANPTTAALALLLIVLFVATGWGSKPAVFASLLGIACFNFFFLPPFGTFSISEPENWIAFVAFMITAITAGQLSARARRRAKEAEAARQEVERLYRELQQSFEKASHAEALRQSEKLKSALLDAVTHDLRTPLTSIKASITTLLDDAGGPAHNQQSVALDLESRTEMMEVIDEETDRLSRFITGLIELARIEAGELQLRRSWGTVEEIVSAALTRAQKLTAGHKIKIEVEPELPVVRVDERAVSEVVYTLVDNAAKYSAKGTTITISAHRFGKDMIEMSVADEGEGIEVAMRERVFDKFFRATRDGDITTRRPSGTGMGLAIAKGIVEAHSGNIWVDSGAGGRGSKVVFTLPIGDAHADDTRKAAHAAEAYER